MSTQNTPLNDEVSSHFFAVTNIKFGSVPVPDTVKKANELLKSAGMLQAMTFIADYLDKTRYPFIRDEDRDKWLLNRLKQVQQKYFDDIK